MAVFVAHDLQPTGPAAVDSLARDRVRVLRPALRRWLVTVTLSGVALACSSTPAPEPLTSTSVATNDDGGTTTQTHVSVGDSSSTTSVPLTTPATRAPTSIVEVDVTDITASELLAATSHVLTSGDERWGLTFARGDGPNELGVTVPSGDGALIGPGGLGLLAGEVVAICDQNNGRWLVVGPETTTEFALPTPAGPTVAAVVDGVGLSATVSLSAIDSVDLRTGEEVSAIRSDTEIYSMLAGVGHVIIGGPHGPTALEVGDGPQLTTEVARASTGETDITVSVDGAPARVFRIGTGMVRTPVVVYPLGADRIAAIQFDNLDRNLLVWTADAEGVIRGAQLVWTLPWEGFGLINVGINDYGIAVLAGGPQDDEYRLDVYPLPS